MPAILALLILCLLIGLFAAAVWAGDRSRSIHRGAFLIAGLHSLASFVVGLFCCAAAWASAATHSGPGVMDCLMVGLQLPLFLISKLLPNMSLSMAALCLIPSSLLYGYGIASLVRRIMPPGKAAS